MAILATMEDTVSVSAGSTAIFDTVVTNVGNGYNVDDGIFAAQYDGIYQFAATVRTGQNGEVWAYFTLNGKRITYIYARAWDQQGNVIISLGSAVTTKGLTPSSYRCIREIEFVS